MKSLKKFATNSIQEKFAQQENITQLNDYYKSLEAGKIKPKESLPTTLVMCSQPLSGSPSNSAPNSANMTNPGGGDLVASIQFEICKKLCAHYEKLEQHESYVKFRRVLNAESKFAQLAASVSMSSASLPSPPPLQPLLPSSVSDTRPSPHHHHHHGHLYFRIGIFGKSLRFDSIRNRYYLYKHKTYEMLSNIQSLIIDKLANAKWADSGSDDSTLHKVIKRYSKYKVNLN